MLLFESDIAVHGAGLLRCAREELILDAEACLDPEAVGLGGGVDVEDAAPVRVRAGDVCAASGKGSLKSFVSAIAVAVMVWGVRAGNATLYSIEDGCICRPVALVFVPAPDAFIQAIARFILPGWVSKGLLNGVLVPCITSHHRWRLTGLVGSACST